MKKYDGLLDGGFASVMKFLEQYRYYRKELFIACRVAREDLDGLLEANSYELGSKDAVQFLQVCGKLVKEKAMSFAEAQKYITKISEIEERAENDTGN